ncbi:unnamed protein product, partial [Urochloa humidicola]
LSVASSSGRRFPSDTTAIAGWLPSPGAGRGDDLSLGFNAAGAVSAGPGASLAAGLWGPAASRQAAATAAALGYGAIGAAGDVGMLVVAPAGSYHHHHHRAAAASAADDDPVLPLIAAAQRTLVDADSAAAGSGNKHPAPSAGAIQFWHPEPAAVDGSPGRKALAMLDHGRGVGGGSSGSGSGAATCHDCGNQAKKGCAHSRCRTCCNSRGFECETHVRSTWVPASRRRERLQLAGGAGSGGASPPPPAPAAAVAKKPRLACQATTATTNSRTSTSNATTPRSFDTSSSHQDASFKDNLPRQVRGPAVFRCVRVTSVDDGGGRGEGEVAYQAAVTINGHLFRGLLYDHGADTDGRAAAAVQLGTSDLNLGSSASAAAPNLYSGPSAPLILGGLGYGGTT